MDDEVVLWNGELRVRLSSIEAIRHDTGVLFLKSGQRFNCDDLRDKKILKEIELKRLPTTEGHDWQVDVGMTLADLKARMPEILHDNAYRGGFIDSVKKEMNPFDDVEEMMWKPWIIPVIKPSKQVDVKRCEK